jgi:hypothetical protein
MKKSNLFYQKTSLFYLCPSVIKSFINLFILRRRILFRAEHKVFENFRPARRLRLFNANSQKALK